MSSSASFPKGKSQKRPLIKISTKKRTKPKIRNERTLSSTTRSAAVAAADTNDTNTTPNSQGLPSILTKTYKEDSEQKLLGIQKKEGGKKNSNGGNDEFNDDEVFAEILNQYIQETVEEHEIVLAIKSLIQRHAAAICELKNNGRRNNSSVDHRRYIPFVLKPMVKYTFHSKSSSSSSKRNGNLSTALTKISSRSLSLSSQRAKHQSGQIASAYISTGFDLELEQLDSQNKIRQLQLHGMMEDSSGVDGDQDSNDDENIAILLMSDYICGVYDALNYANLPRVTEAENKMSSGSDKNLSALNKIYEKEVIVKLFLDCIHHFGCNGRFVTASKLQSALKSSWDTYKNGVNTHFSIDSTYSSEESSIKKHISSMMCQPQKWIKDLVHMQLLLPRLIHNSQTSCTTSYWYSLPKLGMAANTIMAGRKKVMSRIKKSYNKEIRRSALESINITMNDMKIKLGGKKLANMTGSFHVRDLLARDIVKVVNRPSGEFVRLK